MNLPKARINAYYDDKNKPIKNWVNAIWVAPNVKEEEKKTGPMWKQNQDTTGNTAGTTTTPVTQTTVVPQTTTVPKTTTTITTTAPKATDGTILTPTASLTGSSQNQTTTPATQTPLVITQPIWRRKSANTGGTITGNNKNSVISAANTLNSSADTTTQNVSVGSQIKNKVKDEILKKYGALNNRNAFDNIDDETVERNISVAEKAIQTNIERGLLDKDYESRYPNMKNGMTMFYAASEKNNSKEAQEAREIAYMEGENKNSFSYSNYQDNKNSTSNASIQNYSSDDVIKIPSLPKTFFDIINPQDEDKTSLLPMEETNYDINAVNQIVNEKDVSFEHAKIIHFAEQWGDIPEYKWTLGNIAEWMVYGDEYIHQEKLSFINNYKDVINDAAEKYDIPPFLLAGVAYVEYGGDPIFADDVAYFARSFDWSGPEWVDENLTITKNPDLTSFGNTSIQVRRAIEMLGYDESTDKRKQIIKSLKDPIQNIYMAACHLNILRNVDFPNKNADDLTDEEIKIISSRYNIGPDADLSYVQSYAGYGMRILDNKEDIVNALLN